MKPRTLITLLAVVVLYTSNANAQKIDHIVGTWRLVSWKVTSSTGKVQYPYGPTPEGQLIYTANGQMSAQLMRPGAMLPNTVGAHPKDLMAQILQRFFSYYGTYRIDRPAHAVIHHVVGSLAPSWIGTNQLREVQFLGSDRLQLTARLKADDALGAAGAGGTNVLVWERIR